MKDDLEERVKKAIDEAGAMVKDMPKSLQAVAFEKAFDALLARGSGTDGTNGHPVSVQPTKRQSRRPAPPEPETPAQTDTVKILVDKLNRTEHPEIRTGRTAGDLALFVLRAARDKCGIEWLTPAEISAVLRSLFMLRVAPPAVRMRLGDSKLVDRKDLTGGGKKYAYRLMATGDEYLTKLETSKE